MLHTSHRRFAYCSMRCTESKKLGMRLPPEGASYVQCSPGGKDCSAVSQVHVRAHCISFWLQQSIQERLVEIETNHRGLFCLQACHLSCREGSVSQDPFDRPKAKRRHIPSVLLIHGAYSAYRSRSWSQFMLWGVIIRSC